MNLENLGKKIKELRELAGMDQPALAEVFGFSGYQQISKWETGRLYPSIEQILKLNELFKYNLFNTLADPVEDYKPKYFEALAELHYRRREDEMGRARMESMQFELMDRVAKLQDIFKEELQKQHAELIEMTARRLNELTRIRLEQISSDELQKNSQHTQEDQGERKILQEIPKFGDKSKVPGRRNARDSTDAKGK